eukprot:Seg7828.1 transcript_id=Seg7828.1/GoldUCD/mRNA.D3Y31 product="hypothetical protein" protein_id=Seg7828.1/GoldUCD/D3Y31
MADKIRKCDEKFREENQELYKSVMNILKIPGYVQSNNIRSGSLSIVLCDDRSIRLYRSCTEVTEKKRKEVAARQIEFAKEHISAAEDCALSVINIATSNSGDCSIIKYAMMS